MGSTMTKTDCYTRCIEQAHSWALRYMSCLIVVCFPWVLLTEKMGVPGLWGVEEVEEEECPFSSGQH